MKCPYSPCPYRTVVFTGLGRAKAKAKAKATHIGESGATLAEARVMPQDATSGYKWCSSTGDSGGWGEDVFRICQSLLALEKFKLRTTQNLILDLNGGQVGREPSPPTPPPLVYVIAHKGIVDLQLQQCLQQWL